MRSLLDRLNNPLHLLIALACTWLLASSPWIGLYHALPEEPGWLNLGHVVLGLAMLPLGIVYLAACTVGGRWRLYFPWMAGQFGMIGADLAGVFRGQRPGSEGGGLFADDRGAAAARADRGRGERHAVVPRTRLGRRGAVARPSHRRGARVRGPDGTARAGRGAAPGRPGARLSVDGVRQLAPAFVARERRQRGAIDPCSGQSVSPMRSSRISNTRTGSALPTMRSPTSCRRLSLIVAV